MGKKERKRVLLIAICCDGMRETLEEIGICYIASHLRQNGFKVKLLQIREKDIDYEEIKNFKPDIIGMPVYEKSRKAVYRTSKYIKKICKDVFIIVGGVFPTYCDTELLREAPDVDCIIRGEGESTFLEVAQKYKQEGLNGIKGVTYRGKDNIIINEDREYISDINQLTWPARDLLQQCNSDVAIISTSRGCLANCSFCSNQLFWKKWRGRDAKNVVDEIEYIIKEYNISIFNFADASFEDPDNNCARIRSIAEEIIKRDLKIAYLADFRAEFHRKASEELIELLIESGLCGVCIGIEAANIEDLKLYRKIAVVKDNIKTTKLFQKFNINILPGFINFNPYSTFDGLRKNINFLQEYGFAASIEIVINQYKMYKGGDLQKKVENDGLLKDSIYQYDEIGYNFLDARIATMVDFMHEYVKSIHEVIPFAFEQITNQLELFSCFVFQLKRRINTKENETVNKVFIKFDYKMDSLKLELNTSIASWFNELLDLAERKWDKEEAIRISNNYLGVEYVNETLSAFILNANKLQFNLLKINKDYEKELIIVK